MLFGISSALCAAAPNLAWILVARAFQGTGAALLLPSSLANFGNSFSGKARGRAVGTWSAASAIGGAIGPVLGGWLIDAFGWREIFLLNIPLAIAAAGLAVVYIRDPVSSEQAPIDLTGALVAAASLGLLTWGLTVGAGRSGWSREAIATLGAGVMLSLDPNNFRELPKQYGVVGDRWRHHGATGRRNYLRLQDKAPSLSGLKIRRAGAQVNSTT